MLLVFLPPMQCQEVRLPRKRMINFYIVKRKRDTTEMVACVRAAHPMRRSKARSRWLRVGAMLLIRFNRIRCAGESLGLGCVSVSLITKSPNPARTIDLTSFCPWGSKPSLCIFGGRSSFVLLRGKSRRRGRNGERGPIN